MRTAAVVSLLGITTLAACSDAVNDPSTGPVLASTRTGGDVAPLLGSLNVRLAKARRPYRVAYAEYVTTDRAEQAGQIVFANDRGNQQLPDHFVPGDPRRGVGNAITYLVDQSDGATTFPGFELGNAATEAAVDRAMDTWGSQRCSNLPIAKVADSGADPDLVDGLLGVGGFGTPFADITHAGWVGPALFEAFAPGGSQFIVGITFTFIFINPDQTPTDIDGDGRADVAFREIYYNDAFPWGINTNLQPAIDVETVVLHEAGHGLSQAHFGRIFGTPANGRLHFAPFAVMNAAISRLAQDLTGSDVGGHCSIWGNWPG